jgi:putative ABC transport system substrate-binding protein
VLSELDTLLSAEDVDETMKKKNTILTLCAMLLALCVSAEAQQPTKIARIGYLSGTSYSANSARVDAFRQGLRELGYVEGKTIVVEWRYAEGKLDRLPALAAELVRLKVDVIVASAPPPTRSAKQATATIPIVMSYDDDPVGNGFVASLARPGRNITGLATLAPELSGKQLELLREIVPKLSRVAVIGNATRPGSPQALREVNLAGDAVGVQLQYLEIQAPKDIEIAFRAASQEHAEGVLVLTTPVLISRRKQVAELAVKDRLPTIYGRPEYVEDGGLLSYATSFTDLSRRAATYVDKILKGAKPAELPVEQPTKFELIINLKAAKQIGLTIPPSVLARADKIIR